MCDYHLSDKVQATYLRYLLTVLSVAGTIVLKNLLLLAYHVGLS